MKKITTSYRLNYYYIVRTFASERPQLEASKTLVPQNICNFWLLLFLQNLLINLTFSYLSLNN